MTKLIFVSVLTALIMVAFGIFWMFMWLVGTNGYSEAKGGTILVLNLLLVLLSIFVSSAASSFLTKTLQEKLALSFLLAAPLAVLAVVVASVIGLFVGSLIIVGVVGTAR